MNLNRDQSLLYRFERNMRFSSSYLNTYSNNFAQSQSPTKVNDGRSNEKDTEPQVVYVPVPSN